MNIKSNLTNLFVLTIASMLFAACTADVDSPVGGGDCGRRLTINATTGSDEGTRLAVSDQNGYSIAWEETDKVTIFGGASANMSDFTVHPIENKPHEATLEGLVSGSITQPTTLSGFVQNSAIALVNGNNQIEVNYSEQDGTFQGAMAHTVLFGTADYDPSDNDGTVDMNFRYLTSYMRLTLTFPGVISSTASSIIITGDNLLSISRVNTAGKSAGGVNTKQGSTITIPAAEIDADGKAIVYVALYPQTLSNLKLQATVGEDVYEFDISKGKRAALNAGNVYNIGRTGTKMDVAEAADWGGGTGKEKDPYIIDNVAQLKHLASTVTNTVSYNGKFFKLTSDLIINGEWTPIGNYQKPFRGIFDGNGHTIYGNMTFTNVAQNNGAGLFGYVGVNGTIKNLTNKANVTSTSSVNGTFTGGIVGRAVNQVTLLNCSNEGIVSGSTLYVGGLVGNVYLSDVNNGANRYNSKFEACSNTGNVSNTRASGNVSVGGIVGCIDGYKSSDGKLGSAKIQIVGCYSKGCVLYANSANANYGAGIVGYVMNPNGADQTVVKSCWTNCTLPTKGNRAAMVSSAKNNTAIVYTVGNCWTSLNYIIPDGTGATVENCIVKSATPLKDFISDMNTAWGSSGYEFAADGTIKTKNN